MCGPGASPIASIVIPAWRLPDALDTCLTALQAQSDAPSFETIVVANGSDPAVLKVANEHPLRPTVVPLATNVGFGLACNVGAGQAAGEFVVFLNDDAEPEPGWLAALVGTARLRGAQLVGSVLLDNDGLIAEAGARVAQGPTAEPYGVGLTLCAAEDAGYLSDRVIDYSSGAGLLVSRRLFIDLGGFDPAFLPVYYEDIDLQWRAREMGLDVWLAGAARMTHTSGQSTSDQHLFRDFAFQRSHSFFVGRWHTVLAGAPSKGVGPTDPLTIPRRANHTPPRELPSATGLDFDAVAHTILHDYANWLTVQETSDKVIQARSDTAAKIVHLGRRRDALILAAERDRVHRRDDPIEILTTRLRAIAPHIAPGLLAKYGIPAAGVTQDAFTARFLRDLVYATEDLDSPVLSINTRRWLLTVAVLGRYPREVEFDAVTALLAVGRHDAAEHYLLTAAFNDPDGARAHLHIVDESAVVVEVNYSARSDHHTGIQRVVRETVPLWAAQHNVVLTAWTPSGGALRTLSPTESDRVLRFGTPPSSAAPDDSPDDLDVVVPVGTRILFPDVPASHNVDVVRTLAQYSGNRLGHIGYDLIPLTSAELRAEFETVNTANLFSIIKHSKRVAGISESSASEFAGLAATLSAQGLVGPEVAAITLPAIARPLPPGPDADRVTDRPVVLLLGTRELHKNQRAALQAAELLWREGLDFEVRQVGGPGSDDAAFSAAAAELIAAGRPLTILGRVSEQQLWDEQRAADIAVFASLHEGYGLPVAEALSVGIPVITTRYGSQAEVAADGGCLLVDPRSDDDIAAALRRLITNDALRTDLATQAAARPERTWADYATRLWQFLVEGDR